MFQPFLKLSKEPMKMALRYTLFQKYCSCIREVGVRLVAKKVKTTLSHLVSIVILLCSSGELLLAGKDLK